MTCKDCVWCVKGEMTMFIGEHVCINPMSEYCTEEITLDMMCTEFEAKGD